MTSPFVKMMEELDAAIVQLVDMQAAYEEDKNIKTESGYRAFVEDKSANLDSMTFENGKSTGWTGIPF